VLPFFTALALIVLMLLGTAGMIRLLVDPRSPLWRARGRMRESATVRRASADLDREYASLVDEHRDLTS
jgi:hypothetical protein